MMLQQWETTTCLEWSENNYNIRIFGSLYPIHTPNAFSLTNEKSEIKIILNPVECCIWMTWYMLT